MFTSKQGRDVNKLIKSECANFFDGDCILLECNCPQMISDGVVCRYFRDSVLPLNLELANELVGSGFTKRCKRCDKKVVSKSKTVQYCEFCSEIIAREKGRERLKRHRDSK